MQSSVGEKSGASWDFAQTWQNLPTLDPETDHGRFMGVCSTNLGLFHRFGKVVRSGASRKAMRCSRNIRSRRIRFEICRSMYKDFRSVRINGLTSECPLNTPRAYISPLVLTTWTDYMLWRSRDILNFSYRDLQVGDLAHADDLILLGSTQTIRRLWRSRESLGSTIAGEANWGEAQIITRPITPHDLWSWGMGDDPDNLIPDAGDRGGVFSGSGRNDATR